MRGLKFTCPLMVVALGLSHPTRMRGLKYYCLQEGIISTCRIPRGCVDWNMAFVQNATENAGSHPTRMRGLKSRILAFPFPLYRRIPRGCVDWNDNEFRHLHHLPCRIPRGCVDWNLVYLGRIDYPVNVASHADAWIEIKSKSTKRTLRNWSHPTRMRGLKYYQRYWDDGWWIVASHADAWIEIIYRKSLVVFPTSRIPRGCVDWNKYSSTFLSFNARSHPTRMRGLKLSKPCCILRQQCRIPRGCVDWNHREFASKTCPGTSHPTRMRGLKYQFIYWKTSNRIVASHADAWIEITDGYRPVFMGNTSHPTRMRGLKSLRKKASVRRLNVASHADAWIEIGKRCLMNKRKRRRIPRGCVDWNNNLNVVR